MGEICFFENGYAFSSDDYTTSGIPLIRISNIKDNQISTENCVYIQGDYEDKFQICNGDLLIAMSGATTGKMGIYLSTKKAYLNQRVGNIKVIDTQSLCLEYRNLFLRSKSEEILKLAYGGAQPNISGAMISSLLVPLPPISEQYRIVTETERWFALIEQIEQGKVDLQTTIKQAKSKILDLAIHGKLVPQDPTDEPAFELLKRINPKAEITCDNGQYGKVPEGWCLCRLGDIGEIVTGNTPTKDIAEYYGGSIPFYKPTDLDKGKCVENASDNLSFLGFEQSRKIPANSILVTCIGATIGKTGLITVEGSCNQQINAIIPNDAAFAEFVYYTCISDYLQKEIKLNASATTLPILNKSNFAKLLCPLPPLAEQYRIVAKIEELFSSIDNIQKALEV